MLRKAAIGEGKDWDKLIPYLLFAYREIRQSSTGFSPFELLYGRAVKGPLDILRETWEAGKRSTESVISHVLTMRNKLEKMAEVMKEHLEAAQTQQKHWYDLKACEREFNPEEQVLVLLPTSSNKLLAQWQGPYRVVKRLGKVNYVVDMHDRKKRKRVFHVNMLRKWYSPVSTSLLAEEVADPGSEEEDAVWNSGDPKDKPSFGEQLSLERQAELMNLIGRYRDVFSIKPGKTNLTEHRIITRDAFPVRLQPYRLPYAYREMVQEEIEQVLDHGIIEPSVSEWSAPMVIVKKKDGSIRLCVDYRQLNAVSEGDAYPMPRIDDLIDRLGKANYISTLDLTRGYWQVPVAKESQPKTAFATPFGFYQFTVMPFGLQGAPATFQRLMDSVLQGLENFSSAYLDDLIIFSESWEKHLEHISSILERLKSAGLTVKPKKCHFGASHCLYLGHIVGGGTVRPEKSKIEVVANLETLKTRNQVRMFLGLTGYYRRFIPNYSSVAAPHTDLTRKSAPAQVKWNSSCEHAFQKLKELLCSSPVLCNPDFSKPFYLQSDASYRGMGAVLSQCDENGHDHPVAYFSRKFLPREERYSTVEKECLAIKLAVQAF